MLFKRTLILVFCLASSVFAWTSNDPIIELSEERNSYKLGKSLLLFEDQSASISDSLILRGDYDEEFNLSEISIPNYGVTASAIWIKFSLRNNKLNNEQPWVLFLSNALLDSVVLYEPKPNGGWTKTFAGDRYDFDQREIPHHHFAFNISPSDEKSDQYFMRFKTSGSLQIPLEVLSDRQFSNSNQKSEILYGLFTGAMLIMLFYNLVVFFSLKDIAYLAYCFFIFVNLGVQTAYSGHLFQYIFPNNPLMANYSIPMLMALLPGSVCLFSLSFLTPSKINTFLRKSLYAITYASLIIAIMVFFLPVRLTTSLAGMTIMLSLFAAISAGIISWVGGNKSAKFYVIAWGLLIISGLVTSFRNFGLMEANFFTVHGARFATVLEVILLALSLGDKYNIFKKEKEEAQLEIINMQKEANIKLENRVKERTIELATANEKLNQTLSIVEIEKKKSDDLLLNVLPEIIAKELKEKGKVMPRQYKMSSVLFTDFKNFTKLAEELQPHEVLANLDECFLAFDDFCKKHNMEKIKTIGDGYMAVGGLPVKNTTNPMDAVKTGMDMQNWVIKRNNERKKNNEKLWEIRIGIHTGPLIAGIIGKHKFVYDIWGDTVNMASRIESSGMVGKVSISQSTFELVKNHFVCEHLGKVEAKHKGLIDSYWVKELIE
ncbi:MAG: hypothetical protein KJP00_01175 [Bacteroidia bacterium]|nr:hypothetical protein [Bacteroidia bacterium]